jgi:hypothetical protein
MAGSILDPPALGPLGLPEKRGYPSPLADSQINRETIGAALIFS